MMRLSARLLMVGVLGAMTALAAPYAYLPFRMMNTAKSPHPIYIDSRAPTPAGLELNGVRAAVERAWQTWNAVTCATPKVELKGLTSGVVPTPGDPYDVYSVTPIWVTSKNDPDYEFIFGSPLVTAITIPLAYTGVLETCDTYFNGADHAWSTAETVPSDRLDVESVMLHEAGHCLGLNHFGDYKNAMANPTVRGQKLRALGLDDVEALCLKNPLSSVAGAPCLPDGGCGGAPTLKCLSQPETAGIVTKLCTNGCVPETGSGAAIPCTAPLSCQTSTAFAPEYTGACLLPGTAVTRVGHPCEGKVDCASSIAMCVPPEWAKSGNLNQFWVKGYCTQSCALGQPLCPAETICLDFGPNQWCLKSCRVGLADCRPDYACVKSEKGGVCVPRCYADIDCADPLKFECRTCDGTCVAKQNPSGQVGDICADDSTCGPGQECVLLDEKTQVKQCTQTCGRGCGACPAASNCNPLARGELYCLRNCSAPKTCPTGLRCADTANGRGCMPACERNIDCPVGQSCYDGECYTPTEDGGCGDLCTPVDAGRPIVPVPKDAGNGNGGSGGCGCSGPGGDVGLVLWGAFALLLLARRRG
jgi:hypothetical protein